MTDHRLNATAASLLGFLHERPMTGWDLVATAQERIGDFWSITQSQVYRELARMAGSGLIEAGQRGSRDSQPYALTEAGRAAFEEWVETAPARETIRFPLLLMLSFGRHVSPERRASFLERHRAMHADQLVRYESERNALAGFGEDVDPFVGATLDFGITYERAVMDWFARLPPSVNGRRRARWLGESVARRESAISRTEPRGGAIGCMVVEVRWSEVDPVGAARRWLHVRCPDGGCRDSRIEAELRRRTVRCECREGAARTGPRDGAISIELRLDAIELTGRVDQQVAQSSSAGRGQDRREIVEVVLVVRRHLGVEEALVVGVLEPTALGDDRQVAAELARDGTEALTQLGDRESRPLRVDLGVDHLPAARVPVGVGALLGRARLVDREVRGGRECDLLPSQHVGHQLAAGPAMRALDRDAELLVGQVGKRLERAPGVTFLLEEFEGVEVHAGIVIARVRGRPRRWASPDAA